MERALQNIDLILKSKTLPKPEPTRNVKGEKKQ